MQGMNIWQKAIKTFRKRYVPGYTYKEAWLFNSEMFYNQLKPYIEFNFDAVERGVCCIVWDIQESDKVRIVFPLEGDTLDVDLRQ